MEDLLSKGYDMEDLLKLPRMQPSSQIPLTGNPDIGSLLKLLPFDHFRFEGIAIITLVDVTTEFTLEHIKTIIIEKHNWIRTNFTNKLQIL